jgi:kinetochore protein Spc7/SPC105
LGSPRAANRLRTRKSIAGVEEFQKNAGTRRISLGKESWLSKEFGGNLQRTLEEEGIRDMIAKMTPRKQQQSQLQSPMKLLTPKKRIEEDDIMLTPGMMKREFGPKVASLVKVWEDAGGEEEEEEEFERITLAEFLSMTKISFLDGLGPSTRRRTFAPPEGLSLLQKPELRDYAKAGAVSIPMLELYQFVCPS